MSGERDSLSETLRQWQVKTPLPRGFRDQVWRRIEKPDGPSTIGQLLFDSFQSLFRRPAFALAYVTVLAVGGLALGAWHAREKTSQWDNQLATRYVQAIDPYQKTTH